MVKLEIARLYLVREQLLVFLCLGRSSSSVCRTETHVANVKGKVPKAFNPRRKYHSTNVYKRHRVGNAQHIAT